MADDRVVAEIVSEFFLNTCQLRRPLNLDSIFALVDSSSIRTATDNEGDLIPLSTGSVAEFYIEPMLSCVGDVDTMIHLSDHLAIPQGQQPPTQLPDELHGRVDVYEIIDSEFPGYVYLVKSYLLTEITDDGKYNAVQCPRLYWAYGFTRREQGDEIQGPAFVTKGSRQQLSVISSFYTPGCLSSTDQVPCVRCLSWPLQAGDWPTRHRNYGWPDSATIDHVVSNGCDMVQVAHRLCRQDDWMSKHQWRLSFSRAEITLLHSWMKIQQIVYHMLRFFMKNEGLTDITDNSGSKILSNYNIKTLMMWACEMKGSSWWTGDLNVVGICVKLLHILADWLTDACCPHYFISNCNLFDSLDKSQLTQNMAHRLQSVTEALLAEWFVNNYIRKCARDPYSDTILSPLFDDVSTHVKLQNAVSALVVIRLGVRLTVAWCLFSVAQHLVHRLQYPSPRLRRSLYMMRALSKVDEGLSVSYFTAVTFLQVAVKTNRNPLTDEMLDILSTVCLQSNDVRRCLNARRSSVLSLSQAAKLMKVIANNSHSTVQLIEIELSKAYLYRALRCKDSDSDAIYCLANVYLAVLYYTTGQYQKAIDHCTLVRSQDHSQCSSHVVQGERMPKIDDDIDSALGLAVFYQYVRTAALNQQLQTQYISDFSTELFAHYLYTRCQSVVRCRQFMQMSSADEVQRYEKCFSESSQMFITDVIVFRSVRRAKCSANGDKPTSPRERTKPVTSGQLNTELLELLQRSAVEHLTTYRQLMARDFGSVVTIVTTDFEAMYAYKRGEYQRCLQLSTQNVHALIGERAVSVIFACSEFIQLMDDDLVCVIGLRLLVDPSCRGEPANVTVCQLSLSLYLMTRCQMKLHHPVTSLAQTLDYIQVTARHKLIQLLALDQLLLKLTERKVLRYISVDS